MTTTNLVLLADAYKYSHFAMYPKDTEHLHSHFIARGGKYEKTVTCLQQYYVKKYLLNPITKEMVEEAEMVLNFQGVRFNKAGYLDLINRYGGFYPISIKSVEEGLPIPAKNALITIKNNDKSLFWTTQIVETLLMKLWYPMTVATKSRDVAMIIKPFWEKSSDNVEGYKYAYHNFGDRGSSSVESAVIGGIAHLTSFNGTDNSNAVLETLKYYGELDGRSINASEHSVMTARGREFEFQVIDEYLEEFKTDRMIACVLDSYNIYNAIDYITSGSRKEKIESAEYPIVVLRPDSGEPIQIILDMLQTMKKNNISFTINSKGYKLFNNYRIIWGDGINEKTIKSILDKFVNLGYSAENFAFGSGGDLMQNCDRDTCKVAIKTNAITRAGITYDCFKDPITDPGKASMKGILDLVQWTNSGWVDNKTDEIQTIRAEEFNPSNHKSLLHLIYENGQEFNTQKFSDLKARASV